MAKTRIRRRNHKNKSRKNKIRKTRRYIGGDENSTRCDDSLEEYKEYKKYSTNTQYIKDKEEEAYNFSGHNVFDKIILYIPEIGNTIGFILLQKKKKNDANPECIYNIDKDYLPHDRTEDSLKTKYFNDIYNIIHDNIKIYTNEDQHKKRSKEISNELIKKLSQNIQKVK